jgi:hypothetical protein
LTEKEKDTLFGLFYDLRFEDDFKNIFINWIFIQYYYNNNNRKIVRELPTMCVYGKL